MYIAKVLWRVDDKDIVEENGEKVIRIPEGVEEISSKAFSDMESGVDRVIIPKSVGIINDSAFKGLSTRALIFEGRIDVLTTDMNETIFAGVVGIGTLVVPNEETDEDIDYIRSAIWPIVTKRDEFEKQSAKAHAEGKGGK